MIYVLQVILDLLPHNSSVVVGRMRLEDAAMHGISERGLYTTTKFNTLYLVNRSANITCELSACRSLSVSTYVTDLLPSPSVGLCVCLSVGRSSVCLESVLWQNGWMDPVTVLDWRWPSWVMVETPGVLNGVPTMICHLLNQLMVDGTRVDGRQKLTSSSQCGLSPTRPRHGSLVVSVFDQRPWGRGFESRWLWAVA